MKKTGKKILSCLLSACLLLNITMPAFAADVINNSGTTFSATLDKDTIEVSNTSQTVVMTVNAAAGITLGSIGADVMCDESFTVTSITNSDERIDFTGSVNEKVLSWDGTVNVDQLEEVTNIAVVTFEIPANTPAGEYTLGLENLELTKDYGSEFVVSGLTVSTTLTIEEPKVAEGYTAGLSMTGSTVTVGNTASVYISVTHSDEDVFAAGEVNLTYDATKLTFNESNSNLYGATVKAENGTILLEDYGADKNCGAAYTLAFDAIADGNATIAITSAAFVNKDDAVKSDLITATLSSAEITVEINKKTFAVTLPEIITGNTVATDGEDYTFTATDYDNYDYTVSATMGGQSVAVIDNKDGTFTISNVSGELMITATRTPKKYTVTFGGTGATDITEKPSEATYNTDLTFTMPTESGYSFKIESITIGDVAYTGYEIDEDTLVVKIPGTAITGNVVINVSKTDTEAAVTVTGSGVGAAGDFNEIAKMNEAYTLTIVPEAGYNYTVTATMGGVNVVLVVNDNTYTIENVTGDIVFTIERTVIVDGVSVSNYLTVDGSKLWLILNNTTLADGKVSTYNGKAMSYSDKYGAYCYLVFADSLDADTAKAAIGIADGTAATVTYDMDVNKTGKVDAADAQFTYNIYNVEYSAFDNDATMEKFFKADVNGDKLVKVDDARAIIDSLLV